MLDISPPDPRVTINVARDFSRFPAGIRRQDNPTGKSAEAFRDDLLAPHVRAGRQVTIELDGTEGYGSGFLRAVFRQLPLIHNIPADTVRARLTLVSATPALVKEIESYLDQASDVERFVAYIPPPLGRPVRANVPPEAVAELAEVLAGHRLDPADTALALIAVLDGADTIEPPDPGGRTRDSESRLRRLAEALQDLLERRRGTDDVRARLRETGTNVLLDRARRQVNDPDP